MVVLSCFPPRSESLYAFIQWFGCGGGGGGGGGGSGHYGCDREYW